MTRPVGCNRRRFLASTASAGLGLPLARPLFGIEPPRDRTTARAMMPKPAAWKMDLTLYDRPGWSSHGWYHTRGRDGSILVPVQSSDMSKPYGDFLRSETDDLVLRTDDGGRSWTTLRDPTLTSFPWGCYGLPAKTRDGKLISVVSAAYVLPAEERRAHLERYHITQFYGARAEWIYTPWPASMADRLRKQGIYVFAAPDEGGGQLVFSLNGFVWRTSSDNGETWVSHPITGLPFLSDEAGSFRHTMITRKGTWIASVFGTPNPERKPVGNANFGSAGMPIGSYALRSEDEGQNWRLIQIAYDPSGEHSFDETALVELPSGRILSMLRHTAWTDRQKPGFYLYQSYSDDDGKTWSAPANSGMWGYPAHLLLLKSGKILCTYGYRFDPWGHRAALSSDGGKTWDVERVKVLRDDCLQGWTTYPMSSQMEDGTIFTTYGMVKKAAPGAMPPPERVFNEAKEGRYPYVAASLYSEDYFQPQGRP